MRSRDWFASLIREEMKTVPASRILMGGFSQGAVMSLFTGVTTDLRLGAIFVMSGYLALANEVLAGEKYPHAKKTEGERTPVVMFHGDEDRVINLDWAEETEKAVKGLGYEVDLTIVPYVTPLDSTFEETLLTPFFFFCDLGSGMGHSINQRVLDGVTAFIKRVQNSPVADSKHDEL